MAIPGNLAVVEQMAHAMIVTPAILGSVHHVAVWTSAAAAEKVAHATMAHSVKLRMRKLSANPAVVTMSPAVAEKMVHATSKVTLAMRKQNVHRVVESGKYAALWT